MASANTRLDTLSDLIKHEANLRVCCRCGSVHVIDAARFRRYCHLRNWNQQLEALITRLRCRHCGKRPDKLRATPDMPAFDDFFPRDERGWKLLQRRLRN